ncbi:Fic family protein [Pseudodesulfovibrio piezophilus]|uniref:Fic family protein n=1 Tax=Pseudodesulfovibrio piezophilus TaxID=879567 RepID=UPI000344FBF2
MAKCVLPGNGHFWFVTLHPFDDGNGRLARAITDMAMAQDKKTSLQYTLTDSGIPEGV